MLIVSSYIFGSFVAGALIGGTRFKLSKVYGYGLLLEAGAISTSFLLLKHQMMAGEMFAAFACGLQNAMSTLYSGGIIRTTHMTGISTDIGIISGQYVSGRKQDAWKFPVFGTLFLGYMTGAFFGALLYFNMGANSLLLPSIWCAVLAVWYFLWDPAKQAGRAIFETMTSEFKEIGRKMHLIEDQVASTSVTRHDAALHRASPEPRPEMSERVMPPLGQASSSTANTSQNVTRRNQAPADDASFPTLHAALSSDATRATPTQFSIADEEEEEIRPEPALSK